MDSDKIVSIVAICLAAIALALSGYAIVANDSGTDHSSGNFTDEQITDLVENLKTKGGKIYTAQGSFDLNNRNWTLTIQDRMIVAHFTTYNQDYYIPFSSIDYIYVNG